VVGFRDIKICCIHDFITQKMHNTEALVLVQLEAIKITLLCDYKNSYEIFFPYDDEVSNCRICIFPHEFAHIFFNILSLFTQNSIFRYETFINENEVMLK
jgi:hypothetical protein